jgi:hypothetical protein
MIVRGDPLVAAVFQRLVAAEEERAGRRKGGRQHPQ